MKHMTVRVNTYGGQEVRRDLYIQKDEMELAINYVYRDDCARVVTNIPSIMKGLLALPEFEVEEVSLQAGYVVNVAGYVPVGSLSIREARKVCTAPRYIVSLSARKKNREKRHEAQGRQ